MCKFKKIIIHKGPLTAYHTNIKVYIYNIMVKWETGETTTDPLFIILAYDTTTCVFYDDKNNLLKSKDRDISD